MPNVCCATKEPVEINRKNVNAILIDQREMVSDLLVGLRRLDEAIGNRYTGDDAENANKMEPSLMSFIEENNERVLACLHIVANLRGNLGVDG